MFRHLLVPTDGSARSLKAARIAAGIAQRNKAKITAIHVTPPYDLPLYPDTAMVYAVPSAEEYARSMRNEARKMLAAVESEAKKARVACATVAIEARRPWEAIVRAARSRRCDLIVMASHGRHGLEGLLLGSETNKVLTHTKTPVLVCR